MNKQIGLGKGWINKTPRLTQREVLLCTSLLRSEHFQRRFRDKWVLVDGFQDDEVPLFESYGFKKVISLLELLSLETKASPWIGLDFQMGWSVKLKVLAARRKVCRRFGMSAEELRN